MSADVKLRQGTAAWFAMVGRVLCDAARQAEPGPERNLVLVERYTDGDDVGNGLVQGLRFAITRGTPSFRIGVEPGERGDITIEITAAAARRLNLLRSSDPGYQSALQGFLISGDMRVHGDPTRLGGWMEAVHDAIVEQTA